MERSDKRVAPNNTELKDEDHRPYPPTSWKMTALVIRMPILGRR